MTLVPQIVSMVLQFPWHTWKVRVRDSAPSGIPKVDGHPHVKFKSNFASRWQDQTLSLIHYTVIIWYSWHPEQLCCARATHNPQFCLLYSNTALAFLVFITTRWTELIRMNETATFSQVILNLLSILEIDSAAKQQTYSIIYNNNVVAQIDSISYSNRTYFPLLVTIQLNYMKWWVLKPCNLQNI